MIRRHLLGAAFAICASSAAAHPHVYVDGRIDFVFDQSATLQGIELTWLYDPFETLFILSTLNIDPGDSFTLTEAQRAQVVAYESDWTETFDGAARLAQGDKRLQLARPENFDVSLKGNQLEVRFTRSLETPVDVAAEQIEVTFYEDTFYYAFHIAEPSQLIAAPSACTAEVAPFDPDAQASAIQAVLAKLGREETPDNAEIGALFTDRVHLSCA